VRGVCPLLLWWWARVVGDGTDLPDESIDGWHRGDGLVAAREREPPLRLWASKRQVCGALDESRTRFDMSLCLWRSEVAARGRRSPAGSRRNQPRTGPAVPRLAIGGTG
jgi:hypothetical protein